MAHRKEHRGHVARECAAKGKTPEVTHDGLPTSPDPVEMVGVVNESKAQAGKDDGTESKNN